MPATEFRVGELRRHVRLGSEAIYRVCGWDRELVELEVVSAPGLIASDRLRVTVAAAAQMTVVGPADDASGVEAS